MGTHKIGIGRIIAIFLVIVLAITGSMTLPQALAQAEGDTTTGESVEGDSNGIDLIDPAPVDEEITKDPVSAEIPDLPPEPRSDDPDVAMLSTMDAESAIAEPRVLDAPDVINVPGIRMSLDLLMDGTGHGTASQTFINSENGYAPGDNSPNDGYVATNDVVTYLFSMAFSPGPSRTVEVQIPDTDYLKGASNICTSGPGYTARYDTYDHNCYFTLQHGANGDMTRQFSVNSVPGPKAISEPQYLVADTSIGEIVSSDPVTVISAPREDVMVSTVNPINADTGAGRIRIRSYFASPQGWSSEKGRTAPDNTNVVDLDASGFPIGTTFNNKTPDSNGIVRGLSVDSSINVQVPPEAFPDDVATAGEFEYHIDVEDGALDKDDAKNFADGKEPGSHEPSNYSTRDADQGIAAGSYYPNNNYSRIGWVKRDPGTIAGKSLYAPVVDRTLFTDGSRVFSDDAKRSIDSRYGTAADTQTSAEITVYLGNSENGDNVNRVAIADAWDKNEQMIDVDRLSDLAPTWGGKEDPTYQVYYATKNVLNEVDSVTRADNFGSLGDGTWTTTMPAVEEITAVAVETNRPEGVVGAVDIKSNIPLKTLSVSEYKNNNIGDGDTFADFYTASSNGEEFGSTGVRSFRYHAPSQPRPRVLHEVSGSPGNGALQTWTITPQVYDYQDPDNDTFSPRVSVLLDKCVHSVTVPDYVKENYDVSYSGATPGSNCDNPDGEESHVVFTAKHPFSSDKTDVFRDFSYMEWVETLVLPEIVYSGRISAAAPNREEAYPITNTAYMTLLEQNPDLGPAVSSTIQSLMVSTDNASIKEADAEKVEIGNNLGWTLITYNRDGTVAGDTRFIDVLPYNGSEVEGYNGEKTRFNGTLTLVEAKVLEEDSAPGTRIEYTDRSPELINQDNPDDPATQWHADPSSIGGNSNVTAIRVTIPDFGADGSLASTVNIEARPDGAQAGDIFVNKMGSAISDNNNFDLESGPVVTEIVDSSIAGVVWWDENNDSHYSIDEPGIEGVEVSLNDSTGTTIESVLTDDRGRYLFDSLTSGDYTVSIERGDNDPSKVPLKVTTQYDKTEDIAQTYSYGNARFNRSTTNPDVALNFDSSIGNADFGFYRPAPSLKIDKEITGHPVENEENPRMVDLTYTVSVANDGNVPSQNTVLTDVAESEQDIHDEMSSLLNAKGRKLVQLAFSQKNASYALDNQGQVWTWGYGNNGELGLGPDVTVSPNPTRVLGGDQGQEFLSDIVSISAVSDYVLAIDREGQVWGWGNNNYYGVLGIGEGRPLDSTDYMRDSLPKRVKGGEQGGEFLQDVISVGLAENSAYALTSDGSVWSWGSNQDGALGVGKNWKDYASSFVPVQVVSGGQGGQYLTGITKMEAGSSGRVGVIDNQSRVFMWGENNSGASGNGGYTHGEEQDNAPTSVLSGEQGGQYLTNIIDLGILDSGVLFLDSSGNVWAAGRPNAIGINETDSRRRIMEPVRVLGGEQGGELLTDIKSVDGGNGYLYALGKNGDVFVAGWSPNSLNKSGSGKADNPVFTRVLGGHKGGKYLTGIGTLVAHSNKIVAIDSMGISYGWGDNISAHSIPHGSLGVEDTTNAISEPHRITIFDKINYISPHETMIYPDSFSVDNGRTSRVYDLGTLHSGQVNRITMEATVDATDVEQFLTNQVYVRSDFTPAGEPVPTPPTAYTSLEQHNDSPHMIDVDSSAVPNIGWEDDTDRVDQVPVYIPAYNVEAPSYSQTGGRLWHDKNRDGLIDDDEPGIPGEMVIAYVGDDEYNVAGTAVTDSDGYWSMELKNGFSYTIEYPEGLMIGDKKTEPSDTNQGDPALSSRGQKYNTEIVSGDVPNVNYGVNVPIPSIQLYTVPYPNEAAAIPGNTFTTTFVVIYSNLGMNDTVVPSIINSFEVPDYTTIEKIVVYDPAVEGPPIGENKDGSDSVIIEHEGSVMEPSTARQLRVEVTSRIDSDVPDTDAVADSFTCSPDGGGIRGTVEYSGDPQEGFEIYLGLNTACVDVEIVRPSMEFTKSINGNDADSSLMAVDISRNENTMDIGFSVTNNGNIDLENVNIKDEILKGNIVSEDINKAIEDEIRYQGYGNGIIESIPVGETVEITLEGIPTPEPGSFHGDEATVTGGFSHAMIGTGEVSTKDQAWAFTYPSSLLPSTGGSGVLAGILIGLIVTILGAGSYFIARRRNT